MAYRSIPFKKFNESHVPWPGYAYVDSRVFCEVSLHYFNFIFLDMFIVMKNETFFVTILLWYTLQVIRRTCIFMISDQQRGSEWDTRDATSLDQLGSYLPRRIIRIQAVWHSDNNFSKLHGDLIGVYIRMYWYSRNQKTNLTAFE